MRCVLINTLFAIELNSLAVKLHCVKAIYNIGGWGDIYLRIHIYYFPITFVLEE